MNQFGREYSYLGNTCCFLHFEKQPTQKFIGWCSLIKMLEITFEGPYCSEVEISSYQKIVCLLLPNSKA